MEVSRGEAVGHALWEARRCYESWALCATRAMLRKALDLWSADYRDRHGLTFDKKNGERDDLYWRLEHIARRNELYRQVLAGVMDFIRERGNESLHHATTCAVCDGSPPAGNSMLHAKQAIAKQIELVERLVGSTMADVAVRYSAPRRPGPATHSR